MSAGLSVTSVYAAVDQATADKLGTERTCSGSIKAANANGTIPEATGKYVHQVPGWNPAPVSGEHPIDPYANESPILVITAQNYQEHSENLSEGQKRMFQTYPETYKINVYPGHRDYSYNETVCGRFKWNALNAKIVDGGMGLEGIGQGPFPFPQSGEELLRNILAPVRPANETKVHDVLSVMPSGRLGRGRSFTRAFTIGGDSAEGPRASNDGFSVRTFNQSQLPARDAGAITMIWEPWNYKTSARQSWSYNPSTRRVRQMPGYGFDQLLAGTNGTMTIDEDRLFNGSPERYNWKIAGQREMYVPANGYRLEVARENYDSLLTPFHPNPQDIRYELRRVWILEANLKEGYRHIYSRRVLVVDEDFWTAVMADNYDTRGELWKHAFSNVYYHPLTAAWQAGAAFYHDLNSRQYTGYSLTGAQKRSVVVNDPNLTADMFTPDAARAVGR